MKRLLLACLLAVANHGWAADLDPECYTLYEQFLTVDWVNAGRVANRMHDMQCWPALQGVSDNPPTQPAISTCNDLAPRIVQMVNDQNDMKILKIYDAKPFTYDAIDRVLDGMADANQRAVMRGQTPTMLRLQYDELLYVQGKGYFNRGDPWTPENAILYGDNGAIIVPNSEPFTGSPPTGTQRILNCSAEARYTDGVWLIQMYMDQDSSGEGFIGMTGLVELR